MDIKTASYCLSDKNFIKNCATVSHIVPHQTKPVVDFLGTCIICCAIWPRSRTVVHLPAKPEIFLLIPIPIFADKVFQASVMAKKKETPQR